MSVGGRTKEYRMRTRSKLLLAALTAAMCMAMAVGSASATRLNTNANNWKIVWTSLSLNAPGAGATVTCAVTLEGSFHSTSITKTSGSLVGYVQNAEVRNACTGGTARALRETLPWHVRYDSFTGTLPTITGVKLQLVGARFNIFPSGLAECLTETTAAKPAKGIANVEAGGRITSFSADSTATIPLRGGFLCSLAGEGNFSGNGTATQKNGEPLTVRLIR
jgi:hypothetical protein